MEVSVPQFKYDEVLAPKDLRQLQFDQNAGDTPNWFLRVGNALDALEEFIATHERPTRVSVLPQERASSFTTEAITLPVKGLTVAPYTLSLVGTKWEEGPGWGYTNEVATVELAHEGANWAAVDTFGSGSVRLLTDSYDSGWLTTDWTREIHFPLTTSTITIQMDSPNQWKGFSDISLGIVQYTESAEVITQGIAEVELTPTGTEVTMNYGTKSTGPFGPRKDDFESQPIELVPIQVMNTLNLGCTTNLPINNGSYLFVGKNAYNFELITEDISRIDPLKTNSPEGWLDTPQEVPYRGIITIPTSPVLVLKKGDRFRFRCTFETLDQLVKNFGFTYKVTTPVEYTFTGDDPTHPISIAYYLNGTKVNKSFKTAKGVNTVEIYGECKVDTSATFTLTNDLETWYAKQLPLRQKFVPPASGYENGLTDPFFQVIDMTLITTISGLSANLIESSWVGPNKMHLVSAATSALLVTPKNYPYVKIQMYGGEKTPVVRVKR